MTKRLVLLAVFTAMAAAADPPAAIAAVDYSEYLGEPVAALELPAATRCCVCGKVAFRDLCADPKLADGWTCRITWPDGRRDLVCGGPCHEAFERAHVLRAAR